MNRRQMIAALGATALIPTLARAATSPADLRGDIAILREALTLHPGLYRYASPAEVEARIAALETAFAATATLDEQYLVLSRFLATIRCGHSYANFFNQRKAVTSALFDRPTRLPFSFRWIDGRMIVTRDASGTGALLPGSEVRTINVVAARDLLARLMPYARADGHNDAKRVSLLEVHGDDSIEYFDVFHGLLFGAPRDGAHRLDIRTPDRRERNVTVPAIALAARRAAMSPAALSDEAPTWTWTMRADGIALLTMPGWAVYDAKWNWRDWLDVRLASLSGATGLVIDLRGNEGGVNCGDHILARLTTRDIEHEGYVQKLRFRRTPATLDRYLDTWDDSFRTLGVGGADLPDGFIARPGAAAVTRIAAVGPRITCPVAALIGPVNSSATFQFAAVAKRTGLVRTFGSPTGGNRRGINGGCFFFVRLPASGLEFDVPLVGEFPTVPQPDAGLLPDVAVAASADDIAHGRDPVLERAAAWARSMHHMQA